MTHAALLSRRCELRCLRVCFSVLFSSGGRIVKRIGMGIVGAGFVGPHHVDAVRRLGFVDVVAVAGSSEASADKKAEALGVAQGLRQLRGAARRSRRPGRPQRHAELPALSGQRRGDRQGQARRLRQAAGDDGRRGEEAARPGDQGRHRPRRDLQLPRQPARAAGAARDRARRHRHAALSSSATTCRTGCSRTPTTPGGSSPTRAAPRRRSATSARTGATWRSTSAAFASRTCSATSRR